MSSKLLACPFCEGEAAGHDYGQEYWVQCQECGVRSGSTTDRDAADTWWNLRSAPPELAELQATIATLKKLLGQARGMVNGASDEWHNFVEKVLGHE